ncbi:methylated-DNA--[protein]-cysteine S-methyltransferase [Paenalcaligenes sp. Me131]|uniref:methylated-DNA--[protein]-cysteine S-methyltransferase n=1 Tax=Paenalcaligenes sp. Me131 TaxID=3392636 RepID=UPI003D2B12F1
MRTPTHHTTLIAEACRQLQTLDPAPSLAELAASAGLSSYHFHRVFKAETGLTPKAYAAACRAQRLRTALQDPKHSVTDAIYEAGFNSNSRFYEQSQQLLGMPAKNYKTGGAGSDIRFALGQCSLGAIAVAQSQHGVCAILLDDDPQTVLQQLQDLFPNAQLIGDDPDFDALVAHVVGAIEQPNIGIHLPLDIQGTAFQERVWQALREIPPGRTISYSELAQRIGSPKAVRAVANACGANKLAFAIPCHRVVRSSGELGGYRWGLARKQQLLQREQSA